MALPSLSTVFSPPPGYSGPSYTFGEIEHDINTEALKYRVDPRLALAYILQESGGNPYAQGDYSGGQPTSFGLAQLHRGGELGNLTPQQAFNPVTNLDVSLSEVAGVQGQGGSPGAIAARAQRPRDQAAYAASVNALYQSLGGDISGTPGGQGATLDASKTGQQPGAAPIISGGTAQPSGTLTAQKGGLVAQGLSSLDALLNPSGGGGFFSFLNPTTDAKLLLARGTVVFVGFGFGLAGLVLLVSAVAGWGSQAVDQVASTPVVGPAAKAAAVAAVAA